MIIKIQHKTVKYILNYNIIYDQYKRNSVENAGAKQ